MAIEWSNQLSTGLEWQDIQHREMLERMDGLLEAMNRNEARAVIEDLLAFLEDYTHSHFGSEERFMSETDYPALASHRGLHRRFTDRLHELQRLYKRQGASSLVIMHLQRWLRDWLLQHIVQEDQRLGAWARERPSSVP